MTGRNLPEMLKDIADEDTLAAVWSGVERGRARYRRRRWAMSGAAAAVVVGLVGAWLAQRPSSRAPAPLTLAVAPPLSGQLVAGPVRLSDDSVITATPGSRLEVIENSGHRLQLSLRAGQARFEVTPSTGREWHVAVGELSVDVVGTVFTIERTPEATRVAVERGSVVVQGDRVPDHLLRLVAGDHFELDTREVAVALPPAPAPPTAAPALPTIAPSPAAAPFRTGSVATALLEKADGERRAGHVEGALTTLTRLVDSYPTSPEAGLAAFTIAQLREERGETKAAIEWYGRAVQLGVPRALEEAAQRSLEGAR